MPDQNASLAEERWARFTRDQQLLMIRNEMHRATKAARLGDASGLLLCYERVLRLTGLTVAVGGGPSFRRELLRWRGLVAEQYLAGSLNPELREAALKTLLGFSPAIWAQRPFLLSQAEACEGQEPPGTSGGLGVR